MFRRGLRELCTGNGTNALECFSRSFNPDFHVSVNGGGSPQLQARYVELQGDLVARQAELEGKRVELEHANAYEREGFEAQVDQAEKRVAETEREIEKHRMLSWKELKTRLGRAKHKLKQSKKIEDALVGTSGSDADIAAAKDVVRGSSQRTAKEAKQALDHSRFEVDS